MIKAPIKYFGGKGGMYKEIIKYFPAPESYHIYCEPFGGSASILLSQPLGHVEMYNDIYQNVYCLYSVLSNKESFLRFKEKCDLAIYSEHLREEFKFKLKTKIDLTAIDRAFYYWYVNRTSHNGIGGFSTNCYIRRNMSKSTSDFLSCVDRLRELHDRLSAVIILNQDALELIKNRDAKNVFFYIDSPYHHSTRTSARYECDFSNEQHEQLIDILLNLKGKALVSGYICDAYKRLETKFKRIDFPVKTVSGTFEKKTKIESLWKNY